MCNRHPRGILLLSILCSVVANIRPCSTLLSLHLSFYIALSSAVHCYVGGCAHTLPTLRFAASTMAAPTEKPEKFTQVCIFHYVPCVWTLLWFV